MKDTLLTVPFSKGTIKIWHSSYMGSIADVFQLGNSYRFSEGKSSLQLAAWITRQDVSEYIAYLSEALGRPAVITKKGKGGGTWAHLKILIDAATSLSPAFKDEVYDTFISGRLLAVRDESGELFKDVNSTLALYAESILGKDAHQGHFIQLAKTMRIKILSDGHPGWDFADAKQLQDRSRVEQFVCSAMEAGLITSWEQLKNSVERFKV